MTRRIARSVWLPLVVVLAWARGALAEDGLAAANGDGFDTHLFRPALDSKGFFHTNGSQILGAGDVSGGLVIDYGNTLLRVGPRGQNDLELIKHSFQGSIQFNVGIANAIVAGLTLPVNLMAGEAQQNAAGQPVFAGQWTGGQVDSQTLGSPAIHGKWRILRVERGLGVAVTTQLGLPLTDAPKSGGADPGFFVWPQLVVDKHFFSTGWLKVGLNGGYRAHAVSSTTLALRDGTFKDGNRATYSLGVSVRVAEPLDLVGDMYGTYLLGDSDSKIALSNEATGGIKLFVERNSYFMLGGGGRITDGVESANLRGFVGFVFEPSIGDRDGDGIKDDVDKCPDQREDFDGFEDEDGCPDPDNDKDGILDVDDRCPNDPEDFDGDEDQDGCPESRDGDRDGDGIPDSKDKCPDVPEDKDGFEDEDGCPEPDNDKDGIPDKLDQCPNDPETKNGFEDEDGCPDEKKTDVIVGEGGLVLFKKIAFERDSAEIKPESFSLVDQIAKTIMEHPEIQLMEVAGHADERAPDYYNLSLTQRRVDSVMAALVQRGVEKGRLRSKGYGEYCPDDPGHDEAAWEKNRRVEFKIVKNSEGGMVPQLGCANATKHGVKPDPIPGGK